MSLEDIKKACSALSVSNCLDINNLTLRHLHYARPSVYVWLKELFNNIVAHGYVPEGFAANVIIPTVKNKNGNCNDALNYRPISIEPVCTKLFEQCLVPLFEPYLSFHDNQFGFVKGGGCNKALYAFRSTVEYFQNKGSRVYVASLDMCKAFDRVNHCGLLLALMKRGVPMSLINVLYSWFSRLSATVCWNNMFSSNFNIMSGVPQGSLFGPKFFNCIMDDLLQSLECERLGCYVNNSFLGAIAYADDLLLLSSSLTMLQRMIDVCCDVGMKYDLVFNPAKTVCGVFGVRSVNCMSHVCMSGRDVQWSDSMMYLGIMFVFGLYLSVNITNRINKFHASLCAVLKDRIPGFEHVYVYVLLHKCLPILFYGLDSISINCKVLQAITKAWNMAFRWIYGLRKHDSTRLLLLSCGTMSAKFLLERRLLLFYRNVYLSNVKCLHNLWLCCKISKTFRNLLSSYYLLDVVDSRSIYVNVENAFIRYCHNAQ